MAWRLLRAGLQVGPRGLPSWSSATRCVCSTPSLLTQNTTVQLIKSGSVGLVTVDLPAQGPTVFSFEPMVTVRQFVQNIVDEDTSVERARIFDFEGDPVAGSVRLSSLATEGFQLVVNKNTIVIDPLDSALMTTEGVREEHLVSVLAEIKALRDEIESGAAAAESEEAPTNVSTPSTEDEILHLEGSLADTRQELENLESAMHKIHDQGRRRGRRFWMVTLAAMSAQFGFLAELTFNQFSWDLMEPVTYFVTYGTSIALVAYYVSTQTAFDFGDVSNREVARVWHKEASRAGFDIERYNELRATSAGLEARLAALQHESRSLG
eukprot:m.62979 g.62979  ORF g.62979 m.62979 type:complete len:323 (+) comp9640_c0_seq1:63-1031(+)